MCVCVCVCVCMCMCMRAVWCRSSPTCERERILMWWCIILLLLKSLQDAWVDTFQDYQHAKNAILEPRSWYKEEALFCMQMKVKKEVAAININLWEIWEWYFILLIHLVFILLLYYIKLHQAVNFTCDFGPLWLILMFVYLLFCGFMCWQTGCCSILSNKITEQTRIHVMCPI